jgi:hypothetical protein
MNQIEFLDKLKELVIKYDKEYGQECMKLLIDQYNQYEKNIQHIWVGEGWYKSVPNSLNYFAAGFEAGMNYAKESK